MSFYTLHEEGGQLVIKRERTDGLRFLLHAHTDRLVDLAPYKAFKHFKVPSFKQHVINFAGLEGVKKSILVNFFLNISFRGHAFNRNKSCAFVVGLFPSLETKDVLKVYVILRTNKDRHHFMRILLDLDPCCIERRYSYPGYYFAIGIINRLVIFVCLSMWCECATHIDWYYIRQLREKTQEITYFIHSRKIGNELVDVVIPRYMTYDKRYVQRMSEDKPLPLYYLCLSRLLTLYCGCIQTQRSYRKRKYED